MTEEQKISGGQRAVACPGWKWKRGATTIKGWTLLEDDDGTGIVCVGKPGCEISMAIRDELPDLSDPATVGCLAALARDALAEPEAYATHYAYDWAIERYEQEDASGEGLGNNGKWGLQANGDFVSEATESGAWLAALEAAGKRRVSPCPQPPKERP